MGGSRHFQPGRRSRHAGVSRRAVARAITWAAFAVALLLVWRPRWTPLLFLLAGVMLTRYGFAMPVAGNNKMITAFMNASILVICAHALFRYRNATRHASEHLREHAGRGARACWP